MARRESSREILGILGLVFVGLSTLIFSGCLHTYKIAKSETPQGKELVDKRKVIKENVRSVKVYNEWATEAMFDVLWMSEASKNAYVDLYARRRGKTIGEKENILSKENLGGDENIVFYLLADVRDKLNPSMSEGNPAWTAYLDVDGKKVPSKPVVEVDLGPEVQELFGHRYKNTKFKTSYRVEFPAKQVHSKISSGRSFKMILSSVSRQCEIGWQGGNPVVVKRVGGKRDRKGKLIKDEDYYWL